MQDFPDINAFISVSDTAQSSSEAMEPVKSVLTPQSQIEDLDISTNDKVEGNQSPRIDNRSHNPEAIQHVPPTDSGFASTTHHKHEHAQKARRRRLHTKHWRSSIPILLRIRDMRQRITYLKAHMIQRTWNRMISEQFTRTHRVFLL